MMTPNAQIISRHTEYGQVSKWEGPRNGIAEMYGSFFKKRAHRGDVVNYGRLRLRVIEYPAFIKHGMGCDIAAVMLESPHAQLFQLYREKAEAVVRFVLRCEAAVRAFQLKPLQEGSVAPFTAKVADWLL